METLCTENPASYILCWPHHADYSYVRCQGTYLQVILYLKQRRLPCESKEWLHTTRVRYGNMKCLTSSVGHTMQITAMYGVREHICKLSCIYNRDGYSVKQKNYYIQQESIWCRYGNMKYKNITHWSLQGVSPNEAGPRTRAASDSSTAQHSLYANRLVL